MLVFVLPSICFTQIFLTGCIPWKAGLPETAHSCLNTEVAQVSLCQLCQLWRFQQCQSSQVLKKETLKSLKILKLQSKLPNHIDQALKQISGDFTTSRQVFIFQNGKNCLNEALHSDNGPEVEVQEGSFTSSCKIRGEMMGAFTTPDS